MSKLTRENISTAAYVLVGVIAVLVVGYVNFRGRILHFHNPMLPFIILGLFGGLIYDSVHKHRAGLTILLLVLFYAAQVVAAQFAPDRVRSLGSSTFGAAAVIAIPVGFALLAGSYAQQALARLKIGRFIVMGLIVAAGYGLMMVLFLLWSQMSIRMDFVRTQATVGLELGAAMGLGFELVDLLGPRRKHQTKQPAPGS